VTATITGQSACFSRDRSSIELPLASGSESSGEAHGSHGWPAGCLGRFCSARRMRHLRPRRRRGDFPAAFLPRFGGCHLFLWWMPPVDFYSTADNNAAYSTTSWQTMNTGFAA
jgi:hypothetical protein